MNKKSFTRAGQAALSVLKKMPTLNQRQFEIRSDWPLSPGRGGMSVAQHGSAGQEADHISEPREGRHNLCRPSRGSTVRGALSPMAGAMGYCYSASAGAQ